METKTTHQIVHEYFLDDNFNTITNENKKWVSLNNMVEELNKHAQSLAKCDIIHIKGKAYDFANKETSQGHYAGVQAQIQLIEELLESLTKRWNKWDIKMITKNTEKAVDAYFKMNNEEKSAFQQVVDYHK